MTKQQEEQIQALISAALVAATKAIDDGDVEMAEYFKEQAHKLLMALPKDEARLLH